MAVDADLACKFYTKIGQLWMKEQFSDLTISVADYQFHCHKFHLCAVSEFCNILLGIEGKGTSAANGIRHVKISGITPEIFGLVLKAVYKGENCVDENNMIQVWHAAHELQVDVLVSKCEDFVMAHMTLDNYENIYQSSVLLESARVRDFALEFMAKHLAKFRQTSLFQMLPSKFLMSIVSSKALVVESAECLVDSILLWANHKSEDDDDEIDNNTLAVTANDSKRETQLQTGTEKQTPTSADPVTEKTGGDKQCVEVMFRQPPAGLEDESSRQKLRQILQETERREETLGKLLNLAKLEQTSPDYLKSLVDNDWLMGNKEARKIVWEARDKQISANFSPKIKNVYTACGGDKTLCEDVFVYKVMGSDTIVAHPWTTGKRYNITPYMQNYFEHLSPAYNTPPRFVEKHESGKTDVVCKIGETELIPGPLLEGASHPVLVCDFLYCVKEDAIYRKAHLQSGENLWLCVARVCGCSTKVPNDVTVYEDQFVLLYSFYQSHNRKTFQRVHSFNTADLTVKHIGEDFLEGSFRFITLDNDHQLYMLNEVGNFWKVNLRCDPGKGLVDATKDKKHIFTRLGRLYSVASQEKQLIILADLPQNSTLPKFSADLGLHLKFVQAMPQNQHCYRARIPISWLQREV